MSSDDDFDKVRVKSKKDENSLMWKMVFFSVGLLMITGVAYYLIEIKDWDKPIELTDIRFFDDEKKVNELEVDFTQQKEIIMKDEYWTPEPEYVVQCETWIEESGKMVEAHDGIKDITLWDEEDREKILNIEENFIENCLPSSVDVEHNLARCTVHYITIQRIISQMEPEGVGYDLHSIPMWQQEEYQENYQDYFGLYCNKITDKIFQHPSFMEYNATRQ